MILICSFNIIETLVAYTYIISFIKTKVFFYEEKNLVIRIEIKKRDLEARFLLSLLAAIERHRVFIGNASQIEWAIKKKLIKRI